jgi:hypothetical protein
MTLANHIYRARGLLDLLGNATIHNGFKVQFASTGEGLFPKDRFDMARLSVVAGVLLPEPDDARCRRVGQ